MRGITELMGKHIRLHFRTLLLLLLWFWQSFVWEN